MLINVTYTDCVTFTKGETWSGTWTLFSGFYQLDLTTSEWISLDEYAGVKGGGPSPRVGHAATTVGAELYIDGGNNLLETFGDLWRYTCALFLFLYLLFI